MNILVLMGSPRAKGNTAAMVEAFAEGAKEVGHEVTIVNVANKNIKGCVSCEYCHTKGNGVCIQKDDMQEIYSAIKSADMMVLASPIYYFTMSAQLQATIQRMYCMMKPDVAKMAMLLSSHSPNVYAGAIAQYKDMLGYCGIEDAGIITAYGEENKSVAKLAEIKEFAKSL